MSIVSVHGPNMWGGTGAGGGGTGAVTTAPQVQATADMTNGFKFTFEATDKRRPAADYDWAFPGGTPATQADSHGPILVTYATGGAKTATLTIAAGSNPAGGSYPITVQALTAGPRMVGEGEEEAMSDSTPYAGGTPDPANVGTTLPSVDVPAVDPNLDVPPDPAAAEALEGATPPPVDVTDPGDYDPGEHTVAEVTEYAQTLDVDGVKALIKSEEEGKGRSTLVSALSELLPFDPGDWTVDEVKDYVDEYPEEREAALEAERAGKNRKGLVTYLETPPETE
jgi:hypothetical protein